MRPVLQDWVMELPLMQQGVLLGAMRGADGMPKYNSTKYLLRWFRRCTLRIAFGQPEVIWDPITGSGGSYTGPSVFPAPDGDWSWPELMRPVVDDFIKNLDAHPHHFVQHFRNAIEVAGYKHPDTKIRAWWFDLYCRLVIDEHLHHESMIEMDKRLGDNYENWLARCDEAVSA